MKIGVYSKEADHESVHENNLLAEEIKANGHEYVLINYGDGSHAVSPNDRKLYRVEAGLKKAITDADLDVVIPRINEAVMSEVFLAVSGLRALIMSGIPSVNTPEAIALAKNKFEAQWVLEENGIMTPESLMPTSANVASSEEMLNAIESDPFVEVVIKRTHGTVGQGTIIQPTRRYGKGVLDSVDGPLLIQKFVKTPGYPAAVSDVRVVVVGDETISYARESQDDLRSNVYLDHAGVPVDYTATDEENELAIRATRSLGLDSGGVDIYQLIEQVPPLQHWHKTGELAVGEVNASSGFGVGEELERSVCAAFVRFAIQKALASK